MQISDVIKILIPLILCLGLAGCPLEDNDSDDDMVRMAAMAQMEESRDILAYSYDATGTWIITESPDNGETFSYEIEMEQDRGIVCYWIEEGEDGEDDWIIPFEVEDAYYSFYECASAPDSSDYYKISIDFLMTSENTLEGNALIECRLDGTLEKYSGSFTGTRVLDNEG